MPQIDDITLETLEGIEETASRLASAPAADPPLAPVEPNPAPTPSELARESGTAMAPIETYQPGEQGLDPQVVFGGEGYRPRASRAQMTPQYARKLAEVARVYKQVIEGRIPLAHLLQETMMSSEFSTLLGSTLDRILLAKYATYQPSYRDFMKRRTVRDFRSVGSARRTTGGLLTEVPEATTYPSEGLSESSYTLSVTKYGKKYDLTWEMLINDDLEAFTSLPGDMAEDAIQTEMYLASSLYVGNTTLFHAAHSITVDGTAYTYSNTGTAALAVAALEDAFNAMLKFPGDQLKPLNNSPVFLVVPPALKLRAMQLLGSMQLVWAGGDSQTGIAAVAKPTNNPLEGLLVLKVDPYIPVIDTTNGHTSWHLFADPRAVHAAEYAFLRGYEQPQMFMRTPNSQQVGGGPDSVDFDSDTRGYKVRHVFGGSHANATGGWRACYRSTGAG